MQLDDWEGPLAVAIPYTLAVFFGEKSAAAQAAALTTLRIPEAAETLDLSVTLVSSDFDTPAHPQILTVGRDGKSDGRALFECTARHDGPSTISVLVNVAGNFLQRLEVTFDVGAAAEPTIKNFGRPIGAAEVLEARTATMQFMPAIGGYQLIATAISPDPIDIRITPDELAARIEGVREVMLETVQEAGCRTEPRHHTGGRHDVPAGTRVRRIPPLPVHLRRARGVPRSCGASGSGCAKPSPARPPRFRSCRVDSRCRGR